PTTTQDVTPEVASVALHVTPLFGGSFFSVPPPMPPMPPMAGGVGGCESRLIVTGWFVVPPGLVAVHVKATTPSPATVCGSQLFDMTGASASLTFQLSPTVL